MDDSVDAAVAAAADSLEISAVGAVAHFMEQVEDDRFEERRRDFGICDLQFAICDLCAKRGFGCPCRDMRAGCPRSLGIIALLHTARVLNLLSVEIRESESVGRWFERFRCATAIRMIAEDAKERVDELIVRGNCHSLMRHLVSSRGRR